MKNLIVFFAMLSIGVFQVHGQEGKVITVTFRAVSLEGNLVGDSPDRNVTIYLPPDYEKDSKMKYPVLYLLHGFTSRSTGGNLAWFRGDSLSQGFNVRRINQLINNSKIKPMIVVMPDACNQFGGSMYTNSITTGYWEDFITKDLVDFVDTNYRTIPSRDCRGIAGHSMGGYGAIKIAMKHPNIFRSVYGSSPCCMDINPSNFDRTRVIEAMSVQHLDSIGNASFGSKTFIASAAAFSPNPDNPPFFADFPFKIMGDSLSINENVKARWLANYPSWMADQYVTNLQRLHAIALDAGNRDIPGLMESNQYFSETLKRLNVRNTFEVFDGGHVDKVREIIENKILPFFSEELVSNN